MATGALNPNLSVSPIIRRTASSLPFHSHLHFPYQRHCGRGVFFAVAAEAAEKGNRFAADLVTLGNLCVDVVLSVPELPPPEATERKAYMDRLAASPPDERFWEAGGNCNLAIAAARLGLNCATIGIVGKEIYGTFLLKVLQDEGIDFVGMTDNFDAASTYNYHTLLCWVLVDPFQRHGFCSPADFSTEPAFSWISVLPSKVVSAIQKSKILFCNGYAFDEFYPDVIISAIECAIEAGTEVFFDPGPRGRSLSCGSPAEQKALRISLKLSDVVLLTADEAESLTGIANPVRAGQELLKKGIRTQWVVIKMGCKGSILITKSSISSAPAFKVKVLDTVGCGDSFTAAVVFGFLHGMPAINTLVLANAVGAATATGCGAGRNVAHLEKVLELLSESNLNEDDAILDEIVDGNSLALKVSVLSGTHVNGVNNRTVHVPVHDVVSSILPMFEVSFEKKCLHS